MADGFTVSEQLLEKVMPSADLNADLNADLYEQMLATHVRFWYAFIPVALTEAAAGYGATKHTGQLMFPDEPRGLRFKFKMHISGGGTSAEAKIRLNSDAGTDLEKSTAATSATTVEWFFDIATITGFADTIVQFDIFMKATGGGTCNVADMAYAACTWEQAA